MESSVPKKITSRRFLIRDLYRNIEFNKKEEYVFNGYVFSVENNDSYYVSSPDGSDIGTVKIKEITESWLKTRCNKSKKKEIKTLKKTRLISKPRKVKRYDIISNEFMLHLHSKECIVDGCFNSNIEAHHVYGRQPWRHDILCVPLCKNHHTGGDFSVHEGNVESFRKKYTKAMMEKIAIQELGSWINNEGSYILSDNEINMFIELIKYLSNKKSGYNDRIKEFLIEYERNS